MGRMGGACGQTIGTEAARQAAMAGIRCPKPQLVKARGAESAQSELAGRLIEQAQRTSDVRLELVARLRMEIDAGTYRIDAMKVAGSIMRAMLA